MRRFPFSNATVIALGAVLLASGVAKSVNPLVPYDGPSVRGVDTRTLTGKGMTGYQGWFNCEGDGAGLGWPHCLDH